MHPLKSIHFLFPLFLFKSLLVRQEKRPGAVGLGNNAQLVVRVCAVGAQVPEPVL
jgi:hypothetical protein